MEASRRTQFLLFLALLVYTAFNLVPIVWAGLTSIKLPVDAFTIPPTIFFKPTFQYHYEIWVEQKFWMYLVNSLIISGAVVLISVPIGTLAAYALSRSRTWRCRSSSWAAGSA
jgi:multiple sugar transport system permease protein